MFKSIELLRHLPLVDQILMRKPIQHNAHFAHSEWILLTMLCDANRTLRERAVKVILGLRSKSQKQSQTTDIDSDPADLEDSSESEDEEQAVEGVTKIPKMHPVRIFKVPKLNFEATSYVEMIDWKDIHEPPLVKNLTNDQLQQCIEEPLEVPNYPCHTQMVERAVKNVTEASSLVIGQEARDGFIQQRIKSRTIIPKFESKQDHLPLLN